MRKALLLLLSVSLIASVAVACGGSGVTDGLAAAAGIVPMPDYIKPDNELLDVEDGEDMVIDDGSDMIFDDDILLPEYVDESGIGFATGIIVSIEVVDGKTHVTVENSDGGQTVLVLGVNTVFPFSDSFDIGDEATGWYWYSAGTPMALIYPPKHDAAMFVTGNSESMNLRVSRFHRWEDNTEGYYLSQDKMFAFRVDENTEVTLEDGTDFTGSNLSNRRIAVFYGRSTRSLPELTTADRVIVFYESIMPFS